MPEVSGGDSRDLGEGVSKIGNERGPQAGLPSFEEMKARKREMLETLKQSAHDPSFRQAVELQAKVAGFHTVEEYIASLEKSMTNQ